MTIAAPEIRPLQGIQQKSLGALLGQDFPARYHIVKPFLRNAETAMVWAATGVGKSMFVNTLALLVAGGGSFAGWTNDTPRKVLFIDGEMNEQDLQERLRNLAANAVEGIDLEAAKRNLVLCVKQAQRKPGDFYDVTNEATHRHLISKVKSEKYDLVVIDNLSTLSKSLKDENDAAAFKSIMEFLVQLKAAGVAAIMVHHANKGGKDFRGSTAIAATFEVIIGLEKPEDAAEGAANFKLSFGKYRAKGDDTLKERVFLLGDFGWTIKEDDQKTHHRIVKAAKSLDYVNQKEIASALGVSQATVSAALSAAEKRGELRPFKSRPDIWLKANQRREELSEDPKEEPDDLDL